MDLQASPVQPAVIPAAVSKYVSQFSQFSRTTSEAIVNMGRIVHEAKSELPKELFEMFCGEIRYDANSSSIRKLKQIGEMAELLSKHTDRLPNNWTTMYTLTKLGSEVLESKLEAGVIHATLAGKEAAQLVSEAKPPKPRKHKNPDISPSIPPTAIRYRYELSFDDLPTPEQLRELEVQILNLLRPLQEQGLDCQLIRSDEIKSYLAAEQS